MTAGPPPHAYTPVLVTDSLRTDDPAHLVQLTGHDQERKLYRHPSDAARLVFTLLVLVALLLLGRLSPGTTANLTVDVLSLVEELPAAITDGLVGLVQLAATIAPFVIVVALVRQRRLTLLFILALAAALAAVAMSFASSLVEESVPIEELNLDQVNSWFIGSQYPSATFLAALTAVLVASSPWLTRRWRWAGWIFILGLVVARALTATEVPLRSGLLLAIGAAAGSLALLLFGAPRRRVDVDGIAETLRTTGIDVAEVTAVEPDVDQPLFAVRLADGTPLRTRVLGRDERDTDLLLGAWRALTVKGLSDEVGYRSPLDALQHEALALSIFGSAGTTVPRPVAVVETPDEAAALAMTDVPGRSLAELTSEQVADAALADAWRQVAHLQHRRLAHRSLSPHNVVVDGDRVTFVDLRRASLQPTDEVLAADVAELLAATSTVVGVERAVAAARDELDAEDLARAVPLIQKAVFTVATRRALRAAGDEDEQVTRLRDHVADAADVEQVELAPVQRITIGGAVSLVGSLVLVWYIFSLASDWDQIWDAFASADLVYVIPIVGLAMAPYFTGALSMLGAVPIPLPFLQTTAVMFGQSFLNRFTPANAGGMAMRVRYLQLQGLDGAVAATSIGLTSAASGVAQGVLIVVFLLWGGASDRFSDFEAPDLGSILVIVLIVGLVASVVLASTWGRRVVRPWLGQVLSKITGTIRELAKDPRKMAELFSGAVLGKLANIIAFWLSALAFDVDISFAKAGALYMIANTLGSAVPTPGGVGGIEAALTAALLSFGVDNATAAAIVLLFRVLTFWLPTIPGYAMLRYTQKAGIV